MKVERNKLRASSWADMHLIEQRCITKQRSSYFASQGQEYGDRLQTANSKADEIQAKWILASPVSMHDIDMNRKYDQILEEVLRVFLQAEGSLQQVLQPDIQLSPQEYPQPITPEDHLKIESKKKTPFHRRFPSQDPPISGRKAEKIDVNPPINNQIMKMSSTSRCSLTLIPLEAECKQQEELYINRLRIEKNKLIKVKSPKRTQFNPQDIKRMSHFSNDKFAYGYMGQRLLIHKNSKKRYGDQIMSIDVLGKSTIERTTALTKEVTKYERPSDQKLCNIVWNGVPSTVYKQFRQRFEVAITEAKQNRIVAQIPHIGSHRALESLISRKRL